MSYIERPRARTGIPAFLLADLLAACTGAAILTILSLIESSGQIANPLSLFVLSFFVALLICFVAGVVLGLPVTWLYVTLRVESLKLYVVTGLIAGTAAAAPVLLGSYLPHEAGDALTSLCVGGIPGAISGYVWWMLNRRHAIRSEQ